jgi:hypothetical protein
MNLSLIPCPDQWNIINDIKYDSFPEMIESSNLLDAMDLMFKCPNCERIWIYWNGFGNEPIVYIPETIKE